MIWLKKATPIIIRSGLKNYLLWIKIHFVIAQSHILQKIALPKIKP